MTIFLATLFCFVLAMLLMAVGVLFGRAAPQGSCGGLAALCEKTGEELCADCPLRAEVPAPGEDMVKV